MALLELIEWTDEIDNEMVMRIPAHGSAETKMGSQLVVRENQAAVFFRDGKGLDVFGPGRHTLSTMNLPILSRLIGMAFDDKKSPFRTEVYFVNQRVFNEMKWGTKEPVAFRDSEFGIVRLRAFGTYTLRISQPLLFVNTIVGSRGRYSARDIDSYLKNVIVSRLNDLLGETIDTVLDLPANYDELAVAVKMRLADDFLKYGVELIDFFVNAITPPEEVQQAIDKRASMGAIGDMNKYMKYQTAEALTEAAKSAGEGGGGPMGAGLGAGLGMMMPGMILNQMQQAATGQQPGGAAPAQAPSMECPSCNKQIPANARFCLHCGEPVPMPSSCPNCNTALPPGAKFCLSCGTKLEDAGPPKCSACGAEMPAGTKFCMECGEKL
jgi:membrane protease subunit (stomatin/prohibitin family)